MATKLILTFERSLTEQELTDLRFILPDALDRFVSTRTPVIDYVEGRYPNLTVNGVGKGPTFSAKVDQVARRVALATKMHHAAFSMEVEHVPTKLAPGHVLSMVEFFEMAAELGATDEALALAEITQSLATAGVTADPPDLAWSIAHQDNTWIALGDKMQLVWRNDMWIGVVL